MSPEPLVSLSNLNVSFHSRHRSVHAVRGLDLEVNAGEIVAIVGESGSGKSVTARTLVGLTGEGATVTADRFLIGGRDASRFRERHWRAVRGREIGLVLQDALSSLDPLRTVRREVAEVVSAHRLVKRSEIGGRVLEALNQVGFPDPALRADQYPHQLSGGLRQRALIASAIAGTPPLLIADEPTTALDVTVQAQILELLGSMRDQGIAVVLISHDLAVVSRLADRVLVMRDGVVVESGATRDVLGRPRHGYTQQLMRAVPSAATRGQRLSGVGTIAPSSAPVPSQAPVLEASHVGHSFTLPGGAMLTAVNDVTLQLRQGQKLGIVGESGSGKSTLARILLGLQRPDSGEVLVNGRPWGADLEARRSVQFVSQDPLGSFDSRYTVEEIIAEPLLGYLSASERRDRVREVMELTHLDPSLATSMPRRLSGGQRQRVSIARALALRPRVLIADEPVSALDVSIQAQILDLLAELNQVTGTSLVFISHDLGVVHHLVDEVVVMQQGAVVEQGPVDEVFSTPQHPYTAQLIAAVPRLAVTEVAA